MIAVSLAVLVAARGTAVEPSSLMDVPALAPPSRSGDHLLLRGRGHHGLGSPQAAVVMVELGDYECPFCRRYHEQVFPQIKARYIDTGKVRYVLRDLPLDIHAQAFGAAEAARCAGAQGRFWPMRAALSDNYQQLSPDRFAALAGQVGLSRAAFDRCLREHRFQAAIRADVADALAARIYSTPSFVIGRPVADGVSGVLVVGGGDASALTRRLEEALRGR
jgi:protein-disulfide isomerase